MQSSSFSKIAFAACVALASYAQAGPVTLNTLFGGPINDGLGTLANPIPVTSSFVFLDSNASESVQSVQSITLTGLTHTYVSDLQATLRFIPNDPAGTPIDADLFDGLSDDSFFLSNNLNGNYTFSNSTTRTLQTAAQPDDDDAVIPSGTYAPSAFHLEGDPSEIQDLSAIFRGVNLALGNFVVVFTDFAPGDSGTLTSATLNLTTVVPEPASLAAIGIAGGLLRRRRSR